MGLACAATTAFPTLLVVFPLATDLPQHVAQIRLLDAIGDGVVSRDAYAVRWLSPGSGVYALLLVCWKVVGPRGCGRLALGLLMASWVGATFLLAKRRDRPLPSALLASLFVFNVSLYWGFLNFLAGFPIFALWWLQATRALNLRRTGLLVGLSALLYWAHSLWFAFSCLVLVALIAMERPGLVGAAKKLATQLPVGFASLFWAAELRGTREAWGFDVAPHWVLAPWQRLNPQAWLDAGLDGGGALPYAVGAAVLAWIGAAAGTAARNPNARLDRPLLATAGVAGLLFLLAPDKYLNTIFFAERWLPCAIAWLVLALPAPKLDGRLALGAAAAVFAIFVGQTAAVWHRVQENELSGLAHAIDDVPEGARVLGLDFVKHSEWVGGRPFLQSTAWADAWRGAETHFSFAEHGSSLVRFRERRRITWTPGLEWYAERVRLEDFYQFEYALVNLPEPLHERFANHAPVSPVTHEGRWRLYAVRPKS